MMFITQQKILSIRTIILFKESIVMFNIDVVCKLTIDLKKLIEMTKAINTTKVNSMIS